MNWETCQQAFHADGSWRDIYIFDTNIEDWEKFFKFVQSYECELRYLRDSELELMPPNICTIFTDKEHSHSLSIDICDITLVAHFFLESEIELDINPSEIKSQLQLDRFIEFVSNLGRQLKKDVFITEESAETEIWFKYTAKNDNLTFQLPNWVLKEQSDKSKPDRFCDFIKGITKTNK